MRVDLTRVIFVFLLRTTDDHDVKQFLCHSLYPPGTISPHVSGLEPPKVEEQQKLSAEYAEYQRKLELQKEQWVYSRTGEQARVEETDFLF